MSTFGNLNIVSTRQRQARQRVDIDAGQVGDLSLGVQRPRNGEEDRARRVIISARGENVTGTAAALIEALSGQPAAFDGTPAPTREELEAEVRATYLIPAGADLDTFEVVLPSVKQWPMWFAQTKISDEGAAFLKDVEDRTLNFSLKQFSYLPARSTGRDSEGNPIKNSQGWTSELTPYSPTQAYISRQNEGGRAFHQVEYPMLGIETSTGEAKNGPAKGQIITSIRPARGTLARVVIASPDIPGKWAEIDLFTRVATAPVVDTEEDDEDL